MGDGVYKETDNPFYDGVIFCNRDGSTRLITAVDMAIHLLKAIKELTHWQSSADGEVRLYRADGAYLVLTLHDMEFAGTPEMIGSWSAVAHSAAGEEINTFKGSLNTHAGTTPRTVEHLFIPKIQDWATGNDHPGTPIRDISMTAAEVMLHRTSLGLSVEEYAEIIGKDRVTPELVRRWEDAHDDALPEHSHMVRIGSIYERIEEVGEKILGRYVTAQQSRRTEKAMPVLVLTDTTIPDYADTHSLALYRAGVLYAYRRNDGIYRARWAFPGEEHRYL